MHPHIFSPPESMATIVIGHGPRGRRRASAGDLVVLSLERGERLEAAGLVSPVDAKSMRKRDLINEAQKLRVRINENAAKADILDAIVAAVEGDR